MADLAPHELRLLGCNHVRYGEVEVQSQFQRTACAISVGGEYVRIRKGDLPCPNEDAVLAIDLGPRTLLAVADAHHGFEASHGLIEALSRFDPPTSPLQLLELLPSLATAHTPHCVSESTLLVAVVDREAEQCFGVGFGDSAILQLGSTATSHLLKDDDYVSPFYPSSLDPRRAREFGFRVAEGELVLLITDGIDECHYAAPATSLQNHHMLDMWHEARPDAALFAQWLGELALRGVDGNPGGQDNLAIACTRC